MRPSLLLIALVLAACGEVSTMDPDPDPDPGPDAGLALDASPPDVDAAPPVAPRPSRAVVTAAGTVRAGALTLDVQLGNPLASRTVTGGARTITPDHPIAP